MSEGAIVALVEMIVQGTIVLAFGLPLLAYFLQRGARKEKLSQKTLTTDPQLETRLSRMETSLDSIAIELERISEGQRFTTKLLAEREHFRVALPPDRSTE